MSRSSSDSSLYTDRHLDNARPTSYRKRRLSQPDNESLRYSKDWPSCVKRHRIHEYVDEHIIPTFSEALTPAFFIIKQDGRHISYTPPDVASSNRNIEDPLTSIRSTQYYRVKGQPPLLEANHPPPLHDPGYDKTSNQGQRDHLASELRTRDPCRSSLNLPLRVREQPDSLEIRYPSPPRDESHDTAAKQVEDDYADRRRWTRHSTHERILRSLICPKWLGAEFEIDDDALQGIFYAVDKMFFRGCLRGRVTWRWEEDLESNTIGTTALRKAPEGDGCETRILLSTQILKDRRYNRRLLISTFIHELIHSYLFVVNCDFPTAGVECGGHTDGFGRIAKLIDTWAGPGLLYLCNIEADLRYFEDQIPDTRVSLGATTSDHERNLDHVFGCCRAQSTQGGIPEYITIRETSAFSGEGGGSPIYVK